MCGILAIFCKEKPSCYDEIMKSVEYLSKRGPDHSVNIIKDNGMYLFRRLAINDTSDHGDQPMVDGDIIMMCNGEIYNHKELEEEFEIKCESGSDCEIIFRLYEKIGFKEMVKRLDGVFAIVLVDKNTVYLARDPIGVRPLYIGLTKSEQYLAVSSIPNCLTFCTSVSQFPPGMCAVHKKNCKTTTFDNKQIVMQPLSQLNLSFAEKRVENPIPLIRHYLVEAVKKRLMTDRPIGCLLSGGLDSSIVTAILVQLLGPENVRTYSIGMEGSTDLHYARKVADALGTNHHEILFTPEEGIAVIPDVIEALGSYDITTVRASVGMYLVSKYISENTEDRVIFSGEGSDELLCGYLYFHNAPSAEDAEKESLRLIKQLHHYDVLRADRAVSTHGLELRVPFLDQNFLKLVLQIAAKDKVPIDGLEKRILREAFRDMLPEEVVTRRKDGFSDGVSSTKKSWYMYIQEHVDQEINDFVFDSEKYPSKEAMYYHILFKKFFNNVETKKEYWMPKWTDVSDPSGRLVEAFSNEQ